MPGAPLLAGRGSLRGRTLPADTVPRRPPAPGEAPFGLRMGMTVAELARYGVTPVDVNMGIYRLPRVPRPREGFRDLLVMILPAEGLCRITALTLPVASRGDGVVLKAMFDRMEASMRTAYGPGRRTDQQTDEGRLRALPWMTALLRNERKLVSHWLPGAGSTLPPDLRGIELQANATSATSGFVAVIYEFRNFAACQREAQQAWRRRNPPP